MKRNLPAGPKIPAIAVILSMFSPIPLEFDTLAFSKEIGLNYGGIAYVKFGPVELYYVNTPELAHEVLVEKADKFYKSVQVKRILGRMLGNGLFTSDGEFWKRQRKLAQPAFHHNRIDAYAITMTDLAQRMINRWQPDMTIDVFNEMMQVTLAVVCKTLFDADISGSAKEIGALVTQLLEGANERLKNAPSIRDLLPTKKNRNERRAQQELDKIVLKIIAERRASGEDKGDLLSMLLLATDEEHGDGMTDQQLRDEAMTIFLAGHETTANALTWAWYELAKNPEVEAKLWGEIDAVLGNRPPTLQDLEQLPYTEMIIKESLRMYPPVASVGRDPIEDIEFGGYTIPKGGAMIVNTYAMHHNPKYFADPESFIPERFSKEHEAEISRYAYLPFGAGPRICIGNMFAMMEARLILATVAQRYRPTLAPNQTVAPQQLITIRPKGGLKMEVAERQPAAALAV